MPCAVDQSKVAAELDFWRGLIGSHTREEFAAIRAADFTDYAQNLPEIHSEHGLGLDLGCGPWSVFEGQGMRVVAVDPLAWEYKQIVDPPASGVLYSRYFHPQIPLLSVEYDWVWCVNVIDHTPNPEILIDEVRRVLKPGGHFYFGVWFDPDLYAPHYKLWRRETVEEYLKDFELLRGAEEYWALHNKTRFWGLYER